jgi:uncharacterized heparinase superfamily protein
MARARNAARGEAPSAPEPSDAEPSGAATGLNIARIAHKTEAPDLIEPARPLALASFAAPSISLGDRLVRFAYRLGIPGPALAAPFRKPQRPRLLATVANPLPGNKIAGTALRAGHFQVHGLKLLIAQIDFAGSGGLSPPVERMVHGFHWLADLEASAPREQVAPVAERILALWLAANEQPPKKPGQDAAWSVANTGHRLLGWLVHAPLILSGADKALRARVMAAITDTARWLDKNAARGEDGLARVAGWAAIVAAGLLLPDGRARRLYGEAGLIAALGALLGDDGGVQSRSPIDQMAAIALLLRLAACYQATRRTLPPQFQAVLALLVPPLLALAHGDGSLASWQGGWAVSADELAVLIDASGIRTRPLRAIRQWGYQRVTAGHSLLLLDAAPPPLPRHARHGCASTLGIEFSHAGQRLFVNCGGAAAAGGLMPLRLEQGLRATAAHSTLVLDDSNSTAVLSQGRLGTGVSEVQVDRRSVDSDESGHGATRLEASHDGYVSRYGLTHRRILTLRDDGTELRGEDWLVPKKARTKRGEVAYALRFHLGPGIDAGVSDDGLRVGLALADGSYWRFLAPGGEITLEESIWADSQGRPVPIQQLVLQGLVPRSGGSFTWALKKLVPGQ